MNHDNPIPSKKSSLIELTPEIIIQGEENKIIATIKNDAPIDKKEPLALITENYPHIAKIITTLWGTPSFHDYMEKIIIMDRNDRIGFEPENMAALMIIWKQHNEIHGNKAITDPWSHIK
jgi:hypothetical protein